MSEWIINLLNMSMTASVIAVIVMILRLIFREKAPKRLIVLLWALVAVRLICPISIESSISLMPQRPVQMIQEYRQEHTQVENASKVLENTQDNAEQYDVSEADLSAVHAAQADTTVTVAAPARRLTAWEAAFIVWTVGTAVMLIYMAVSYVLLHRQVRVNVQRERGVYITDKISTSFILGLFAPRIYIPSYLSEEDYEYILAHERRHIRHLDHLWKPFGFVLLSLNWFNPIMWYAYVLLCKDIELACDESVISRLDTDGRKEYSTVLLKCSIKRRFITACPIAFGETGVKERVKAMKNYKKPTLIIMIAVILAGAVAAAVLLTSQKAKGRDADAKASDTAASDAEPFADLFQDSSIATAQADIDNDGSPDTVTYACVGNDGNSSVILVDFGDASKASAKHEMISGPVHPKMSVTKAGDDNLIYISEESQGSDAEQLIYILYCDTHGDITAFDGKSPVSDLSDAMLNNDPSFKKMLATDIGTVKLTDEGDAVMDLKYGDSSLTLTIPSVIFESTVSNENYTGGYRPVITESEDSFEIDAAANTIIFDMSVPVKYDMSDSYDYICIPAVATITMQYENGTFVTRSITFAEQPDFKAYCDSLSNAAVPAESILPTPDAAQTQTPAPSPTASEAGASYIFNNSANKSIDLDGDGKKERIIIKDHSEYRDYCELELIVQSSTGKELFNSYGADTLSYNSYANCIRIADLSGNGTLAVFIDYNTDSPLLSTYGFILRNGKVQYIHSNFSGDDSKCCGQGIISINDNKITIYELSDLMGTKLWKRTGTYNASTNSIKYSSKRTSQYDKDMYIEPTLKKDTYGYDKDGNKVELKSGTVLQAVESDFSTYAWLQSKSGELYKVDVAVADTWAYTINGIHQDDLFVELMYAG